MKRYLFTQTLAWGFFTIAFSQVNTERLRVFGDKPGWNHSFQTTFAYASGNSNFARISGTWRTDFERKPRELMLVANFERGISNDKRYVNKGFGHVRALYRVTEPLKAEVFLQKEYNEFTRLQDRQLAGAGLRWKMIADAHMGQNPKSGVWMYLGIGGMYEAEKIKNEPTETTHLFRSTNYLTIYIDLGNHVSLNAIGYIQVAPAHLKDVRILAENNVTVNLAKNIALTSGMSFRYDNQPPANVKPHDFSLMQGLRVLF